MTKMQFILDDLQQVLAATDRESVQLALLDPPYFMGDKPFENDDLAYSRVVEKWDNQWRNAQEYQDWASWWLDKLYSKMAPGGSVLIFQSFHGIAAMKTALDESPFKFRNLITWYIPDAPPIKWAKKMGIYAHSCQFILYYSKGVPAYFDYDLMKQRNGGAQHRDLIVHNQATKAERLGHPTQKPLSLIQTLVRAHCPVDGLVLDFFGGSGTTAEAAFLSLRQFIYGDRVPEYYDMAIKRVQEYKIDLMYSPYLKVLEVDSGRS